MTPLFSSALLRTQSDQRLVRLAGEGNERAFEAIVDRYRRPLQRYCERALPPSRAEDVVQQVLMKAWLALRDGTEVRSLGPWLYRITRTTALDLAQSPGYDYSELRHSLHAADEPESELEQRTVIRMTLAGVAALPTAQREALLRTAFEGESRAQIAEALGVTEGAVRQLLYRARASLRAAATVITPAPFVNWLLSAGQGSVAGTAVESGAIGAGAAGIAKAGAIVATVGVIAAGPAGVSDGTIDGANKARAGSAKETQIRSHRAARPRNVAKTALEHSLQAESADETGQSGEQSDSQRRSSSEGDSHLSESNGNRGDGNQPEVSRRENGDGEHAQRQASASDKSAPSDKSQDGSGDSADSGSGSGD